MLRVIHGFLVLSEEAWPLFIPPVSRTRASTIGPQQTHAVTFMSCFTSRLTRFTQASSCPTRAWKRAWRWKSSGSRATPRRNIAPSGPPRPTPSTQCGTRSLSCLRRFAPKSQKLGWRLRQRQFSFNLPPAASAVHRYVCFFCVCHDG